MCVSRWMVGLDDLRGLFRPLILWFYDLGLRYCDDKHCGGLCIARPASWDRFLQTVKRHLMSFLSKQPQPMLRCLLRLQGNEGHLTQHHLVRMASWLTHTNWQVYLMQTPKRSMHAVCYWPLTEATKLLIHSGVATALLDH